MIKALRPKPYKIGLAVKEAPIRAFQKADGTTLAVEENCEALQISKTEI